MYYEDWAEKERVEARIKYFEEHGYRNEAEKREFDTLMHTRFFPGDGKAVLNVKTVNQHMQEEILRKDGRRKMLLIEKDRKYEKMFSTLDQSQRREPGTVKWYKFLKKGLKLTMYTMFPEADEYELRDKINKVLGRVDDLAFHLKAIGPNAFEAYFDKVVDYIKIEKPDF